MYSEKKQQTAAFHKLGSRPDEVSDSMNHSSFLIIVTLHAQLPVTLVFPTGRKFIYFFILRTA